MQSRYSLIDSMQNIIDRLEKFQKRLGVDGEYIDSTHVRFKGSKEFMAYLQNEGAKYGVYRPVNEVAFGEGNVFTAYDVPLPPEKFTPKPLAQPIYGYATI